MAEITQTQVHDLLVGTHEFLTSAEAATKARDQLGHLFLDVARQAKVGLRDLSAVSGLHHSTVRAMIQRAIGPGLPDGFEQPELPIYADLAATPVSSSLMPTEHFRSVSSPSSSGRVTRVIPSSSQAPIAAARPGGMAL